MVEDPNKYLKEMEKQLLKDLQNEPISPLRRTEGDKEEEDME
jgi:hypothetical protein